MYEYGLYYIHAELKIKNCDIIFLKTPFYTSEK